MNALKKIAWKTLGLMGYAIQYGCIAHCTLEHIADYVLCYGPSMEPTIHTKDVVLTEHLSTKFYKITKGDVVIVRSPTNPREFICKRVIAMEGDHVCTNPSSYIKSYEFVPRGHVWIEGDNSLNSTDSRTYGPVPYALIRGRVFFKAWPFESAGFIKPPPEDIKKRVR
ncbi:mitochondrial inner membrane protease subunit 1-like [Ptychodera flava]|uniref:mitochondrial inner membrane protease subunit 1-like n=1 Tax=Ptychodera flava TaxID=63121 RepID=UPI00396A7A05